MLAMNAPFVEILKRTSLAQGFINQQKTFVPTGGLEPPIFGLGDRRLIHWATRAPMSNHQNPPSHAPRLHWMTTKFASNQKSILSLAFPPKSLLMLRASVNGGKEERVQISRSIPSGAVHVGCGSSSSSSSESDSAARQRRHFWPL